MEPGKSGKKEDPENGNKNKEIISWTQREKDNPRVTDLFEDKLAEEEHEKKGEHFTFTECRE